MSHLLPAVDDDAFRAWQEQSRLLDRMTIAFIVGPPKCGTTWVMQALDGHSNAVARGESAVGRALVPGLVAAFQQYNAHQKKFGDHRITMLGDRDFLFFLRQIIDRQLLQYIASAAPDDAGRIMAVMDKTPAHSQHVDLLAQLYPRAKFICCTRDVRDGAVSAWFHFSPQGWLKQKTIEDYARVYAEQTWGPMLRDARRSGARLGPQRYLEIEYAEHKADPEGRMQRLLQFLDLPAGDEETRACVDAGSFRKATGGREPGVEERGNFFRKGVVGDWKNHLSPEFGEELAEIAEAVLADRRLAASLAGPGEG